MKVIAILIAIAASLAMPRVARSDDRVRVDITVGAATLSGDYEAAEAGEIIPSLSLSDLGIGGASAAPGARVTIHVTRHQLLVLDGFDVDDSGDGRRTIPLSVGGIPIPVLADIHTTFGLTSLAASYGYAPIATDRAELSLSAGLERLQALSTLRATDALLGIYTVRRRDQKTETGPVVGGDLLLHPIGRLEIQGHARYARLPLQSTDITFYDVELSLAFRPAPILWLRGGYRTMAADVTGDDYSFTLSARGPFVGLTLRF